LFYFLKGELPWQGVKGKTKSEKREKIKNFKILYDYKNGNGNGNGENNNNNKETILISNSYKNNFEDFHNYIEGYELPKEIKDFINYSKNLGYEDCPNYKYLIFLIESLKIKSAFCLTKDYFIWEWDIFFLSFNLDIDNNNNNNNSNYQNTKIKAMRDIYNKLYEGYPINDFFDFLKILRNKKNKRDLIECNRNDNYNICDGKNVIQLNLEENERETENENENENLNVNENEDRKNNNIYNNNGKNLKVNYKQNLIGNYFFPKGNNSVKPIDKDKDKDIKLNELFNISNETTYIGNNENEKYTNYDNFDNDKEKINLLAKKLKKK